MEQCIPQNPQRRSDGFFNLTPFGYVNFAPLFTAIVTCIVFILLLLYFVKGNTELVIKAKNILYVATIMSLGTLVFGFAYFSVVGSLYTVSLVAEVLLLQFTIKTISI